MKFALRRQLEFVAERVSEQVVGRGPRFAARYAYEFRGVVFDGGDHAFLFLVPPFVGGDAVAVAVSPGEERGMSWSGAGVGVVVITVREVGTMVEEEAEAGVAELVAVALEVVGAELVDDDDYHQFRAGIVGGGVSRNGEADDTGEQGQVHDEPCGGRSGGRSHREGSLHRGGESAKGGCGAWG